MMETIPRMPAAIEPILRVRDLAVSFDNGPGPRIQAVDGVRLSLYPGQMLAVVGESGCGKSVTALSALGLIPSPPSRIDRGRIEFISRRMDREGRRDGGEARAVDLLSLGPRELRRIRGNEIAMIFQEPMSSLNPVFTIGEQIEETIRVHQGVDAREARARAAQALANVGIGDAPRRLRQYPHEFSGGMRQRVMIAMALACEPRVLLADEPTTALDVTIQSQILDLLGELKRSRGLAIMLITHALGVVAQHADAVCVMYAGRVVEYARIVELFDHPIHPYTRGLLACVPSMHSGPERLRTIHEVVDDAARFVLPGDLRAWWPWHDAPAGVADLPPRERYRLVQVAPEHWVGVWSTEPIRACAEVFPELPPSRPAEGVPAIG